MPTSLMSLRVPEFRKWLRKFLIYLHSEYELNLQA